MQGFMLVILFSVQDLHHNTRANTLTVVKSVHPMETSVKNLPNVFFEHLISGNFQIHVHGKAA